MTESTPLSADPGKIRDTDDDLDALVSKASRPTLATLFQRGKDAGLIKPVAEYSAAATGS